MFERPKRPVKRYRFDLDISVSARWSPILDDHNAQIPKVRQVVDDILHKFGVSGMKYRLLSWLISSYKKHAMRMYSEELEYISGKTGIELSKLLLIQLLYEVSASSTSIVMNLENGTHAMFSIMDWPLSILKDITIELEFCRNGRTLFIAPTWVGCVGVFTAHVPNNYTVAVSSRGTQNTNCMSFWSILQNVKCVMDFAWPVCYLIRSTAESGLPVDKAMDILQNASILGPCFITVFDHLSPPRSCVITRDTVSAVIRYADQSAKYLLQTDCHHDTMQPLCKLVDELVNSKHWLRVEEMYKDLSVFPIINEETIYACVTHDNPKNDITTNV